MIYDSNFDSVLFKNVANGTNFSYDGQLYLKVLNPQVGLNSVNLSTNRFTWIGYDVLVKVVQVKIVDVK
jgi:hypothetical protein